MTGRSGGGGLAGRRLRLLLRLGRRLADPFVDVVRELSEILDEQVDELCCRAVIVGRIGPGPPRIEDRGVDARD